VVQLLNVVLLSAHSLPGAFRCLLERIMKRISHEVSLTTVLTRVDAWRVVDDNGEQKFILLKQIDILLAGIREEK
jgi:hypothetical protein